MAQPNSCHLGEVVVWIYDPFTYSTGCQLSLRYDVCTHGERIGSHGWVAEK